MAEATSALLNRLLQEAPGTADVFLQKSRAFWDGDWTAAEMEALEREFRARYATEVAQARSVLGEPTFAGSYEEADFPDWCPGTDVSYWDRGDRIAYLWWEHQDKELPFLLVAGAKTKDELAE